MMLIIKNIFLKPYLEYTLLDSLILLLAVVIGFVVITGLIKLYKRIRNWIHSGFKHFKNI